MTYVMSDIHGRYEAFKEMLSIIEFSNDDILFINGDLLDYGEAPLKLLLEVSYQSNIFTVLGDHEYRARRLLHALYDGGATPSRCELDAWLSDGGESTILDMEALSAEDKRSVLDYLDDLPAFEALSLLERNYMMVHGGFANFSAKKPLECYTPEELIYDSAPFGRRYYKNSCVLTGHVPTYKMGEFYRGRMICTPDRVALDCGAAEGICLGCYCLENGEEYYVRL